MGDKARSLEPVPYKALKPLQAEDSISHPGLPPFLDQKEGTRKEQARMTLAATGSGEFWFLPGPEYTPVSPRGFPEDWDRKTEAPKVGGRCERRVPFEHLRKKKEVGGGWRQHIFLNIRKDSRHSQS